MKIYRYLICSTFFLSAISLIVVILFGTCKSPNFSLLTNIFVGIFSSSFLLFLNALIGFYVEKSKFIQELKVKSNALRLYVKKTTCAYTIVNSHGSSTCNITLDENFKTALFEIAPYAFAISESIKSVPSCISTKKIDIKTLDAFCKDITTLAELLCEMQVDKSIKVDIQRIRDIFDPERINGIIKLHADENKNEYVSWTV